MDLFDVYVLRFDVNEERATRALMQVFGLSEAAARIFVHSVPRVGKREVPTAMAERYVRALHAVGAVVECRRSGSAPAKMVSDSARRAPQMSLPAPSDASYAGMSTPPHIMQDSMGIMAPLAFSPDMPSIPKAPRIPADLHQIRARKGPDSLAPNWRAVDSQRGGALSVAPLGAEPNVWSAEPRVLQMSSDPISELQAARARAPKGRAQDDQDDEEEPGDDDPLTRAMNARGPSNDQHRSAAHSHDDDAPLSPSPFASSGQPNDEPSPWYATATHQLLLAVLIVAGMGVALSTGVFETDVNRTLRAFQEAGIDPGMYEPADRYLAHPKSQFQPLAVAQLEALVGRLSQAGAREIWVADIRQQNGRRLSHTLLLDLPNDPSTRRTVFDALASSAQAAAQRTSTEDTGQRFVRVEF